MKRLQSVYKTEDGKLFEDRAQAKRHDAWLELVRLCTSLVEWVGEDADLGRDMAESLIHNSTDIRRILRANPIEGGGEVEPAAEDGGAA